MILFPICFMMLKAAWEWENPVYMSGPAKTKERDYDCMRKIFNWVQTHKYCLAGTYFFVFLLCFYLLEVYGPKPRYIIRCMADDWIPFNEWFVIPYFLWYMWVPVFLVYFMVRDKAAYLQLCFIMSVGVTVSLLVYLVLPNGLDLRQEIMGTNPCAALVRVLREIDPPHHVCPSIHVSSTVAVHLVIGRALSLAGRRGIRRLSLAVTLLICASTMFIKQHSLVDVVCGCLLSLALGWLYDVIRGGETGNRVAFTDML